MIVDGLALDRVVDEGLAVDAGRFAMLLDVGREVALLRVPSRSRVPVGAESRTAGCEAGFRLGGMPLWGEDRIFLDASLALVEP